MQQYCIVNFNNVDVNHFNLTLEGEGRAVVRREEEVENVVGEW